MSAAGKNTFEKAIVKTMKMDETTWLRHASPWSVWTRFSCLPLIVFALWSRQWLDWWALAPLAVALLWTWANPRIFSPPQDLDNWASKVTLGERVWLNRAKVPIPAHHRKMAFITSALIFPSFLVMAYGLYAFKIWPTILGMALVILAKVWFCDRMVWLYDNMRKENAVYASWLQKPVNDNRDKKAA
ncbi:MAG: DUF6653 family protein [Hyphomicrobiales bacterium]